MAHYPCDIHLGRFQGPAAHMYASWYEGMDPHRRRFRVCPEDLTWALELATSQLLKQTEEHADEAFPSTCANCLDSSIGGRSLFYLTAFSGTERWDFFQVYCRSCVEEEGSDLLAAQLWHLGFPGQGAMVREGPLPHPPLVD